MPRMSETDHQVEALLVDLQILVVLQVVDGKHASSFLNKSSVLVDATVLLLVGLANLEDILETVQRNLNDLVVS